MDEGDLGRMSEDFYLTRAIGAIRAASAAGGDSFTACVDCGEAIPQARREAVPGCRRCVACQAYQEG